jgi:hypothetical protein
MDAIKARHAPAKQGDDAPSTLNLQTPLGTVVLQRADAKEQNQYGIFGMEQPDPEELKEMRALDLETLAELRGMLTINQRAAICMW